MIATLPPEAFKTSRFAAEGTVAHHLAEQFLTGKIDFMELANLVGTTVTEDGQEVEITDAMVDGIVEYAEHIASVRKTLTKPAEVVSKAEIRVKVAGTDDSVWGRLDYIIYQKGNELHVFDFKFGKGVVQEEENKQGMTYLLGAQDTEAGTVFNDVYFHIAQPRTRSGDTVRTWKLPRGRLEAFRAEMLEAIRKVKEPGAKRMPGPWCAKTFCPAYAYCPEAAGAVQVAAGAVFTKIPGPPSKEIGRTQLPPVEQFTLEQLARALDWEDSIDSWFAAVRERALAELTKDPNSVPFYKLVEGRSLRIWGDEESVKTAFGVLMGERIYAPRKLLSPAQMEKVVSKEDVARFTVKPPGKPTVVKATDKRQAVVRPMEASVVFDVIPSQELCCSQCRGAGETSPGVECPGCDGTGGIASKKECQNCGCPYSSHNGIGSETCGRVGCGCPGYAAAEPEMKQIWA